MSVKKARQRIENKKKQEGRGATQQHNNNRVATYMYKTKMESK